MADDLDTLRGQAKAWGSTRHHRREMRPAPSSGRSRCPFCPPPRRTAPRATHQGHCNGVTLVSGCEWHVRIWLRDPSALRCMPRRDEPNPHSRP